MAPCPDGALMRGEGAPSRWGPYSRLREGPLFCGVHPVLPQLWIPWGPPRRASSLALAPEPQPFSATPGLVS